MMMIMIMMMISWIAVIIIIIVTIITFISIFLSSLTMVIAMSGSPYVLPKKTKSCYNMRQFYSEAQQNTHPFLLDSKTRLVHMQDILQKKIKNGGFTYATLYQTDLYCL